MKCHTLFTVIATFSVNVLFPTTLLSQSFPQTSTWSGGHSGIPLNGSETEIYSVSSPNGGVFTHFWITGGNKSWIDNAIISFYIDNDELTKSPSVQFQVNLGSGVGFVDYETSGGGREANCPWGTSFIGKASCQGGWYNNIKIPFLKTFRATIKAYLNCVNQNYSIFSGVDFYGYDIVNNGQYYNVTLDECKNLCNQNNECNVYTYHTDYLPQFTKCELKTNSMGMIPTIPTVYSGDTDGHLCKIYQPIDSSFFAVVRGVFNRNDVNIYIGDILIPNSAKLITQYNASGLNPLDYYNIFNIDNNNINGGLLLLSTLAVVSENLNMLEGCFHFYSPSNVSFPGQLISTGTEDYYDSAYYFEGSYPEHLPNAGYTFYQTFTANSSNPYGPFIVNGIKWSAYRMHFMDSLIFNTNTAKFVWRNGDVADPVIGKCFHEGDGKPVGSPSFSWVRSLAFVYLW